jgi:hypothetical protein
MQEAAPASLLASIEAGGAMSLPASPASVASSSGLAPSTRGPSTAPSWGVAPFRAASVATTASPIVASPVLASSP